MNTSEVLNRAADLIEERGWRVGPFGWPESVESTEPLCLEGAILAALGLDIESASVDRESDVPNTCPAGLAVREYLGLSVEVDLYEWNDGISVRVGLGKVAKTASDVIDVLRACALIEAAKENVSVAEQVSA